MAFKLGGTFPSKDNEGDAYMMQRHADAQQIFKMRDAVVAKILKDQINEAGFFRHRSSNIVFAKIDWFIGESPKNFNGYVILYYD